MKVKIISSDTGYGKHSLIIEEKINKFLENKNAFDIIDINIKSSGWSSGALIGIIKYYLPME